MLRCSSLLVHYLYRLYYWMLVIWGAALARSDGENGNTADLLLSSYCSRVVAAALWTSQEEEQSVA